MTQIDLDPAAMKAKSWPFQEARALLTHIEKKGKKPGDEIHFATGFGPSGAPHIGTFGEVVRTYMVMNAFNVLTKFQFKPNLYVFSDDYDAFRKVPDGMPETMNVYLGLPLSSVPDPEGKATSFAQRNNGALNDFVMSLSLNLPWVLASATHLYQNGSFNVWLNRVHSHHDEILKIMLPTLGEERQQTYCAFMPKSWTSGRLMDKTAYLMDGFRVGYTEGLITADVPVGDGHTKLQWKVDWAMRWCALDIDYEMHGKDLIDSYKASSQICRVLGGTPPLAMSYELFVDEEGKKISKSKGNGLSMDDWYRYGSREALMLFMYQNPRATKTLALTVIPRVTDEFLRARQDFDTQTYEQKLDNPVYHIYAGRNHRGGTVKIPDWITDVTYGLLVNLAEVTRAPNSQVLTQYLRAHRNWSGYDAKTYNRMIGMADYAVRYVRDVMPPKERRAPTEQEAKAFLDLADRLSKMDEGLDAESYQFEVYEVGKAHGFEPLRAWFLAIYQVLFGEDQGPRFGAFVAAMGRDQTVAMLREAAKI